MMLYISAAATTNKVLNIFENRFFFEYFQYWDPSSQACNAKHKKRDSVDQS